jgi:uncharacterized protein YeeX (DUF496 family)
MIELIIKKMTPQSIIDTEVFDLPIPILSSEFKTPSDLLYRRNDIRLLELLPLKTDDMRAYYHSLDPVELIKDIQKGFKDVDIYIKENEFPYDLPNGVNQYIIWIADAKMSHEDIAKFIFGIMNEYGFFIDDIILFERPAYTEALLVKGTMPEIRHIHFWHCR